MEFLKNNRKVLTTMGCLFYLFVIIFVNLYNADLTFQTVQTITVDSERDEPVDLPFELSQNETNLAFEFNSTSTPIPAGVTSQTEVLEFPYMAAILHTTNTLLGSGAIVGQQWILVTGFQLGSFKPEQLRIRVGSNYALAGGELFTVDKLYPHPMFNKFNNDIALVKTTQCIVNNSTIQKIAIGTSIPKLGTPANFVTWNGEYQVKSSNADTVPIADCKVFFPDFELTESNICMVLDHMLPYSVALYGSPLVVNMTLIGLYVGLESNTFKPYLCTSLAPLHQWVHRMMSNETETSRLFPIT